MAPKTGRPVTSPASPALPIVLGRYRDGVDLLLSLLAPFMTFLAGATRTGKSVLTYLALAQAVRFEQVRVVGWDFSGVLLAPFPPCPMRSVGPDVESGRDVMNRLTAELDRRLQALRDLGVDSLTSHLDEFPLFLIVAEEWAGLMAQARLLDAARPRGTAAFVPHMLAGLQRLAAESAKINFRLWLIAQRADTENVGGYSRSNFVRRISMRSDGSSLKMLHDDLDPAMVDGLLRLPVGGGLIESPSGRALFRADYISYAEYCAIVRRYGCCGAPEGQAPQGGGLCMSFCSLEAP